MGVKYFFVIANKIKTLISKEANMNKYELMSVDKCYGKQTKWTLSVKKQTCITTNKIKTLPVGCFFLNDLANGKELVRKQTCIIAKEKNHSMVGTSSWVTLQNHKTKNYQLRRKHA